MPLSVTLLAFASRSCVRNSSIRECKISRSSGVSSRLLLLGIDYLLAFGGIQDGADAGDIHQAIIFSGIIWPILFIHIFLASF